MAAEANPDCNNTDSCYCWACHAMRLDVYRGRRLGELEGDLRTAFQNKYFLIPPRVPLPIKNPPPVGRGMHPLLQISTELIS